MNAIDIARERDRLESERATVSDQREEAETAAEAEALTETLYRIEEALENLAEVRPRPMTRMERLQAAADAGYDTWEDLRGEK